MTTEKPKNKIVKTQYHPNGNKGYEESILEVEGELLLCQTVWYENGQKQTEILYSEDKEENGQNVIISETSWNESGLELSKYLRHKPYKKDYAIGDTVGHKKQTEYYTNDQKRSEWNWKIVFSDKDLEEYDDPEVDKHLKKHPKKTKKQQTMTHTHKQTHPPLSRSHSKKKKRREQREREIYII